MSGVCSRRQFLAASAGLGVAGAATQEFRRGGMVYRRLGHSSLQVSLLGFGSHTNPAFKRRAGQGSVLTPEGQVIRDRQIARALDLGVNLVDTYESDGQWEPMARLVRSRRERVLLSLCRQFPMFVGENIDRAVKLFGHVDLYRIYLGDGAAVDERNLEDWDVMRKAKEAGKVRAIGVSTHSERMMVSALEELEGIDYIMFPYNFIHARADYSDFLPAALRRGVGLIAIKPLAAGSIAGLDPHARPGLRPENERVQLYQSRNRPLLPAVVAELTKSLARSSEETLCQAALRFVYGRPFLASAMPGMFEDQTLEDNYAALARQITVGRGESAATGNRSLTVAARGDHTEAAVLDAARRGTGGGWLPYRYRWLDQRWRA